MKKLPGLILGLTVLVSPLVLSLPVKDWLNQSEAVRTSLSAMGLAAPLVFVAASALSTAFGLPRLLFCTLGGWIFGFAWGFAWSHLASLLGAYALFLLARKSTPERLLKRYPKLKTLGAPIGKGWWSVLLVRFVPISGLYNDILLGWSPVSHRDFWIGSFLGFLPLGVTATLVGAGAIHADPNRIAAYLGFAAIVFLLLSLSLKWAVVRKNRMSEETA